MLPAWVAEPGDARAFAALLLAPGHALGVGLDPVLAVVVLHLDASVDQAIHGFVDVANLKVQDGEDGGLVVRLRIDEHRPAGRPMDLEDPHLAVPNVEAELRVP